MGALSRHLRVLVVDDYDDTVTVMCAALTLRGHTSVGASTGREAIVMAQVFLPDVVLLDLGLPDMSGIDVAHQLRQLSPDLCIIVVTGWTEPARREQAIARNDIDAYYLKPATLDEMLPLLRRDRRRR